MRAEPGELNKICMCTTIGDCVVHSLLLMEFHYTTYGRSTVNLLTIMSLRERGGVIPQPWLTYVSTLAKILSRGGRQSTRKDAGAIKGLSGLGWEYPKESPANLLDRTLKTE